MEVWKNIPGFDNAYFVSNYGNVKSIGKIETGERRTIIRKDRILKPSKDTSGYLQTGFIVNGKQVRYLVHRLVMIAFLGEDKERTFVNHKNGIKSDNRLENLEWCTRSENVKHSFKIGLQCNKGENHPSHKITEDIVKEIRSKYIPGKYGSTKLSKDFNLSPGHIKSIIQRKSWINVC